MQTTPNNPPLRLTNHANPMPEYVRADEREAALHIVWSLIALGYQVSVFDGEEFTVKRSQDQAEILAALASTDMDMLVVRELAGERAGSVTLIWGNGGRDLVADWSWKQTADGLVFSKDMEGIADSLEALAGARGWR